MRGVASSVRPFLRLRVASVWREVAWRGVGWRGVVWCGEEGGAEGRNGRGVWREEVLVVGWCLWWWCGGVVVGSFLHGATYRSF